jgi:hypothetical protein
MSLGPSRSSSSSSRLMISGALLAALAPLALRRTFRSNVASAFGLRSVLGSCLEADFGVPGVAVLPDPPAISTCQLNHCEIGDTHRIPGGVTARSARDTPSPSPRKNDFATPSRGVEAPEPRFESFLAPPLSFCESSSVSEGVEDIVELDSKSESSPLSLERCLSA